MYAARGMAAHFFLRHIDPVITIAATYVYLNKKLSNDPANGKTNKLVVVGIASGANADLTSPPKDQPLKSERFQFGQWQVETRTCVIRHVSEPVETQVEPRAMDVLSALCHRAGSILSADDILHLCWDGIAVGENQVHKAVAQLRRALRDSATQPAYIENIRKRGYRTVAPVTFPPGHTMAQTVDLWSRQSPYVGLNPFGAEHASVFFGRDAALARLAACLSAQEAAGRPLVLVLGPSGSGKTSLIQAGLLPSMRLGMGPIWIKDSAYLDLGDVGGVALTTALGGALLDLELEGQPLFVGQSAEALGTRLAGEEGGHILRTAMADGVGQRFALFIDRLEVLFSPAAAGAAQRALFLTALDRVARSGPFVVIAACRNDFYPDLAREPLLMAGKETGGHFDLAPPSRAEIVQMIRLPAQVAGLSFGVDPVSNVSLDDLLCDGVMDNPDALPLLQYTLQQLYQQRSPSRELTIQAYRALDGIEGAIGRRADAILAGLPPAAQAALPRIFSLIVAAGGQDGTARGLLAPWSALRGEPERLLVQTFVEERLFVSRAHGKEPVIGVAHEALLRQWPRAVAWVAEHLQALRIRARLEGEARQWLAEGKRADRLLRQGRPLEEARELYRSRTVPLSPDVEALVNASARHARRADWLRLGAVAGFALIALVAAALGYQARRAETLAAQRREEAEGLVDFMLGDLTEKLQPLAKLDLLDGVAQKAMAYLTAEDAGRVPGPLRLRQAKALLTLADVSRSRGDLGGARRALGQAEKLLAVNLAEGPVDAALLKSAGAVAFWFGQLATDQGALDEAETYYGRYRDLAQRMATLWPDDPDAWIELSYALSNIGGLKLRKGNAPQAAANFEASVRLKRQALTRRPDDRSLTAELANSLSWQANAEAQQGRLDVAAQLYVQQRQVLQDLRHQEPDAPLWSYRIALADRLHGVLLAALGRSDDALATLEDAAQQMDIILRKEPGNQLWRTSQVDILLQSTRVMLVLGRMAAVKTNLSRTFAQIDDVLAANPGNDVMQRHAATARMLLARYLLRSNQPEPAMNEAIKAETFIRPKDGWEIKDKLKAILLADILLLRAEISRRQGADGAATDLCREAIDRLRSFAAGGDFRVLDPWTRAHGCTGDRSAVATAVQALQQMGYRDPDYVQFLTTAKE